MVTETYIGRGVYSVSEAARLVRLPEARIRRWVRGYWSTSARVHVPALLGFRQGTNSAADSLSFDDLLELLYMEHFVTNGVSIHHIRRVAERARDSLHTVHPFSTYRFVTDGRSVLRDVSEEVRHPTLLNLITEQLEPERILRTMLRGDLDLDDRDQVVRWWPMTKKSDVVVDPSRRFGSPIISSGGMPTYLLSRSYKAERSYRRVGEWFNVEWTSVRDAVAFENSLAA